MLNRQEGSRLDVSSAISKADGKPSKISSEASNYDGLENSYEALEKEANCKKLYRREFADSELLVTRSESLGFRIENLVAALPMVLSGREVTVPPILPAALALIQNDRTG